MGIQNDYSYKVGNDLLFPKTTLVSIYDDKKVSSEADTDSVANKIAQGGVIKRAYVPHDVSPLVSVSVGEIELVDVVTEVSYSSPTAVSGAQYYNSVTKKVYTGEGSPAQWDEGSTPLTGYLYKNLGNSGDYYYWNGYDMIAVVSGDIYYNVDERLLYRATSSNSWYTGLNNSDRPKSDRIFVDISTGKMYFWFNDNLNEVGGSGDSSGSSGGDLDGFDFEAD